MNHYKDSDGNRISKKQIDINVKSAKKIKLSKQIDEHGYNFCEQCGTVNDYLDCSHRISVNDCQSKSRIPLELAWDVSNIDILCRRHHQERDRLNVQLNNNKIR